MFSSVSKGTYELKIVRNHDWAGAIPSQNYSYSVANNNTRVTVFFDPAGGITILQCSNHSYTASITQEATCVVNGVKTYTCLSCNDTYTEIIEAKHNISSHNALDATCTAHGNKAYDECTVCGYSTYERVGKTTHNMVAVEGKEATCTEDGYTAHYACECGETVGKEVIESEGHNWIDIEAKEATCLVQGWTAHKYCDKCGDTTGKEFTDPLGHRLENNPGKKATCTEDGYTAYQECARCDYEAPHALIPATGHVNTTTETVDATCTEAGSKTVTCACGEVVSTTEIPATGHINTTETTVEATCTEAGSKTVTCACGEVVSTTEIPATGHKYVDGVCHCGSIYVTITFDDISKRTEYTTDTQVWTENGIIITNNQASSTSTMGNYSNPVRFYKSTELIVEFSGMTKIVFACNTAAYATALGNSITDYSVEVSVSDKLVTVEFASPVDSFTIILSGGQVRMDSIAVYAEPACEHTFDSVPTCKVSAVCTKCGREVYGSHIEIAVPGKDATCTETGLTEGKKCSVCDIAILAQTTIPVSEHNYVDGTCTGCGAEENQSGVTTPTVVLEITKEDFNSTSYAANNTTKTENGYSYTSYQVMNQSSVMQWQKSKGYITISSNVFVKLEIKVSAGSFTVTVGGKAVSGITSNGVTTYDLTGLSGEIKISVGSATGKVDYINFYK